MSNRWQDQVAKLRRELEWGRGRTLSQQTCNIMESSALEIEQLGHEIQQCQRATMQMCIDELIDAAAMFIDDDNPERRGILLAVSHIRQMMADQPA
jgi:uncharacterized protein YutE (UPF0331/DUF86 family)